jgi:hypothetical protein
MESANRRMMQVDLTRSVALARQYALLDLTLILARRAVRVSRATGSYRSRPIETIKKIKIYEHLTITKKNVSWKHFTLAKENVKTLPMAIFDKVDALASPRLVEYWEQDPCAPLEVEYKKKDGVPKVRMGSVEVRGRSGDDLGVTIETQFTVGEYEVVVLPARDSAGLEILVRAQRSMGMTW